MSTIESVARVEWRAARLARLLPIVVLFSVPAGADIVFKGDPQGPVIILGELKNCTYLRLKNPTLKKLDDGFQVTDFSYKLTANGAGAASALLKFARKFDLSANADLTLRVYGNTDVTINGGKNVVLTVPGAVEDGQNKLIDLPVNKDVANNGNIKWDEKTTKAVNAGNGYDLSLFTGIKWEAAQAGDSVTLASEYNVTVVPEPRTLACFAGAVAALLRKR